MQDALKTILSFARLICEIWKLILTSLATIDTNEKQRDMQGL
jgi:hypothetical protein